MRNLLTFFLIRLNEGNLIACPMNLNLYITDRSNPLGMLTLFVSYIIILLLYYYSIIEIELMKIKVK